MEPTEAWVPWEFQLANWTMEPAPWAPGFPVESESTEIYGNSIQTCVHNSSGGQPVEYYEAAKKDCPIVNEEQEADLHKMELGKPNSPIPVFKEVEHAFEADIDMMNVKMHRYPAILGDLDGQYTVPRTVAMGPYHHHLSQLKDAEKAKHVAAIHCVRESGCSLEELYSNVVSVADDARRLYNKDVMEGISYDDFQHMMLFDACFLVQYMIWHTNASDEPVMDTTLRIFFDSNSSDIDHDVWLLENQLPWSVVEAVMMFRPLNLERFVAVWRDLLQDGVNEKPFELDDSYQPPHLLGLLRNSIVGRSRHPIVLRAAELEKIRSISFSATAMELPKIGITVKANETAELADMGLIKKGSFFAELSLAPLSLNYERASRLINMAAFEISTTPSFVDPQVSENSAVCSYLLLLSMLVQREEDVQELRRKGILRGGAGHTNKEALDFFNGLQKLPYGLCFIFTMLEIEKHKLNRMMRTKAYSFYYRHKKTIFTAIPAFVGFITLIGTIVGILANLKTLKDNPASPPPCCPTAPPCCPTKLA